MSRDIVRDGMGDSGKHYSVSVVVPIYNVERYIERSVRSLLSQTVPDVQFIFVDDNSPDRSIEILKEVLSDYPDRKDDVILIGHEVNMGVSRSRADGVTAATAEYLIHADPDDYCEPDMLEKLLKEARQTGADVTICDFAFHSGDSARVYNASPYPFGGDAFAYFEAIAGARRPMRHGALWNKLVRAPLMKSVLWYDDISFCEDVTAFSNILTRPGIKMAYVPEVLYHYVGHPGAITDRASRIDLSSDSALIKALSISLKPLGDRGINVWKAATVSIVCRHIFLFDTISQKEIHSFCAPYVENIPYAGGMTSIQRFIMRYAIEKDVRRAKQMWRLAVNLPERIKSLFKKIIPARSVM